MSTAYCGDRRKARRAGSTEVKARDPFRKEGGVRRVRCCRVARLDGRKRNRGTCRDSHTDY